MYCLMELEENDYIWLLDILQKRHIRVYTFMRNLHLLQIKNVAAASLMWKFIILADSEHRKVDFKALFIKGYYRKIVQSVRTLRNR